jgi:hypothetical protein
MGSSPQHHGTRPRVATSEKGRELRLWLTIQQGNGEIFHWHLERANMAAWKLGIDKSVGKWRPNMGISSANRSGDEIRSMAQALRMDPV